MYIYIYICTEGGAHLVTYISLKFATYFIFNYFLCHTLFYEFVNSLFIFEFRVIVLHKKKLPKKYSKMSLSIKIDADRHLLLSLINNDIFLYL